MSEEQQKIRVAYQGERGAFSEEAAIKLLGAAVEPLPHRTFEAMFAAVAFDNRQAKKDAARPDERSADEAEKEESVREEMGEAATPPPDAEDAAKQAATATEAAMEAATDVAVDCALAPIENSLAGSIHKNYDLLEEHDLLIIGEINLRIVHNLIAPRGVAFESLRRVYSHPVALAQCEQFFRDHPHIEAAPMHDTAGSVRLVVENHVANQRTDEAAIAGRVAAEVYEADILRAGIEDNRENFTRFLLLARPERADALQKQLARERRAADDDAPAAVTHKTSIIFRVANKPSSLFRALAVFALRDINLTKLESRPIAGRPWEYSFYLDLLGDPNQLHVARALAHLEEMAESVRILGSYPSAM